MLIARLTAQLRCYEPEPVDETWARLRHLGARREQLITEIGSQLQQMRDLLDCVWPAALNTAKQPFRSRTWIAALSVVVDRDGGDLARTRAWAQSRFEQAVRRLILRRGGQKPCLRIVEKDLHRADRPGRGDRAPTGRAGTRRTATRRLARRPPASGRHRDPHDRSARRTQPDRAGHLDHRNLTGRGRGDPGPDRRPAPVRHRPRAGQTRRPRAPGETVGHLHRPHQIDRTRPARTTARGLARRLGSPTRQPRLCRPIPAPDRPREQQAATPPRRRPSSPPRSCGTCTP